MVRMQRAYKIRLVNKKTRSLEVNLEPKMQADGYDSGAMVDWVKINGEWMPKLRPIAKKAELGVESDEHKVIDNGGSTDKPDVV